MGVRGRLSANELSVVDSSGGQITVENRPEPPCELTPEQADEWRAVVASLPADWFRRETHAMLSNYCRHAVASRRIAQLISDLESSGDFEIGNYDQLLRMLQRESGAMSSLATRMRMSQQSSYDEKRKKKAVTKKPWA
jgi:hypothetical protein